MHDAVAATEVVCDASRKLVANAMHCKRQTTGPKGMRSLHRYLCVLLLLLLETDKRNESDESWNTQNNRFLGFWPWVAERGFPSLSAEQLVKSAS